MNEIARDAILTLTLLACIFLWANQPTAVKKVQVDYCVIGMHAAGYDKEHKLHRFWTYGYGPCSQLDRYEQT